MLRKSGSSSTSTLRRTERIVLPHTAKLTPEKRDIAHRKNESPMHMVLPLRTAPSQISAS